MDSLFSVGVERSAMLSDCGRYRYTLGRKWADGPLVNFVMFNPSTADARQDDPTIRRCIGFAKSWGFGELVVTNLFAYRATDPAEIQALPCRDAVGPDNDVHLAREAHVADLIVCAWGATWSGARNLEVLRALKNWGLWPHVLRLTKGGHPAHPLCLPAGLQPTSWDLEGVIR